MLSQAFPPARSVGVILATCAALLSATAHAVQPFTPGDVVIYQIGDTNAALASGKAAPVILDEYSPSGTLAQQIAMPTEAKGKQAAFVASGFATGEGYLTLSADSHYLIVPGYNAAPDTAGITSKASIEHVVARVDANGNIDTSTSLTDWSAGGAPRGAASIDGNEFWLIGSLTSTGTVRAAAPLGATNSTSLDGTRFTARTVSIQAGQLYLSGITAITMVGNGTPNTSGQSLSNTGIPNLGGAWQFFFADLDNSVTGVDTVYVADETSGLLKYSLVGGNWTQNGVIGAGTDLYRGLTGVVNNGMVAIYAVRKGGNSVAGGGEFVAITDTAGYNANFSDTAAPIALASAPTGDNGNTSWRGIALVPVAGP